MHRLLLLLLLSAFVLLAPSLAGGSASGDGSLVVSHGSGVIIVSGSGVIFGHFDRGSLTVLDYKADGGAAPSVSGAKMRLSGGRVNVVYSGNDVRFLFPGGRYTLKFDGAGIDISAVGKGTLKVTGKASTSDASFSVNGAKAVPLATAQASASYGALPAGGSSSSNRSS
jgi:hypothetical protein